MVLAIGKNRSRIVAYFAVFIALVTVFDVLPMPFVLYGGIWDSWIFLFAPIIGVLLGIMSSSLMLTLECPVGCKKLHPEIFTLANET